MHKLMLMNAKGGSGKSTIATNLAAYYAIGGNNVVLADFDTQGSSIDWLRVRPETKAHIHGIHAATKSVKVTRNTDHVIMDAPGAIHGRAIDRLVRKVDTLLIPVTPSPVDIRATTRFIQELLLVKRVSRHNTRVAVVANRVRSEEAKQSLARFLSHLHIPLIATLSDYDVYMKASGLGTSIFEIEGDEAKDAQEEWKPLLRWLSGAPDEEEASLLRSLSAVR